MIIIGNGGVGKSSMMRSFCKNGEFTGEYKKTIGVDFLEKRIWSVYQTNSKYQPSENNPTKKKTHFSSFLHIYHELGYDN